jgi:hypothetical protein
MTGIKKTLRLTQINAVTPKQRKQYEGGQLRQLVYILFGRFFEYFLFWGVENRKRGFNPFIR